MAFTSPDPYARFLRRSLPRRHTSAQTSGAVLPGVTVTATQTATGLFRSVVTEGSEG